MPQFIPQHVPPFQGRYAEFIRGYLGTYEWLLPNSPGEQDHVDRDKIRGWSRAALKAICQDCRDFVDANKADLASYCELSGRDMESAGGDFYLSREGHGAGYFDRGSDPVFNRLQDAASVYGEAGYPYLQRGWIRID